MAKKIWLGKPGALDSATESQFANEEVIQKLFNDKPDLIPVDDLGLSELMVVGRETGIESGWPDLIAVTRSGEILIIEFKNEGNAQARREVVGQLLDYGATLWKDCPDYERFEEIVAKSYFQGKYCTDSNLIGQTSLEFAAKKYFEFKDVEGQANADNELARFKSGIESTLKSGDFIYIVVCPNIPTCAKNIIEYMTLSKGIRMYGVEIDYYRKGDLEIIVPRGIAYGVRRPAGGSPVVTPDDMQERLSALGSEYWNAYETFAREVEALGGYFKPYLNGMGAYLPFGNGEGAYGALLWVDLQKPDQPLHVFSKGQMEYYSGRPDLDRFTNGTRDAYEKELLKSFPDLANTLQSASKYGTPATIRDADTFKGYLDFALQFYRKHIWRAKEPGESS